MYTARRRFFEFFFGRDMIVLGTISTEKLPFNVRTYETSFSPPLCALFEFILCDLLFMHVAKFYF